MHPKRARAARGKDREPFAIGGEGGLHKLSQGIVRWAGCSAVCSASEGALVLVVQEGDWLMLGSWL